MKDFRLKMTMFLCCFAMSAISVTVNAQCGERAGLPCDDGFDCTEKDTYYDVPGGCQCKGIPIADCVESEPCDVEARCDDGNPCTVDDKIQADCSCAGIQKDPDCTDERTCTPGERCDDENPCTVNDIYDRDCNCAGTPLLGCDDDFGQVVGEGNGDDDGRECIPGASCDDGDESTRNDRYDADCECKGLRFFAGLSGIRVPAVINPFTGNDGDSEEGLDITNRSVEANKANFVVSPNPAVDEFTVAFDKSIEGSAQVQIFATNGTMVLNTNLSNVNNASVNIEKLTEGTYIIVVTTQNEIYNQRFIKVQ